MIEKEVKQYKRSKDSNSYTYRIDLTKKAGFKGGDIATILNQDEYSHLTASNKDIETELNNKIKEHQKDIETLQKDNKELLAKYNESLSKFNNIIESNNKDIINLTNKLNSYKDTIAGLNMLVGKYKHRNILGRLLNKPLNLNKEDQHLLTDQKK
jgi:superfamily II DNA/RNA helicase